MPRYDYRCERCERVTEAVNTIARRYAGPRCCDSTTELLISAPAIRADNLDARSYYDHGLGARVTSRSQRKRLMQAANLVEADTGRVPPHGAKGTVFSFGGQATQSVPASGAFARRE